MGRMLYQLYYRVALKKDFNPYFGVKSPYFCHVFLSDDQTGDSTHEGFYVPLTIEQEVMVLSLFR